MVIQYNIIQMKLQSGAFSNGGKIPRKYGYKRENISPPLSISGVPGGAKSLAIIMDDPDAVKPAGKICVHWLICNIDSSTTRIHEATVPPGATEGKTDFGETAYGGPAPPDGPHTYIFKLYALDTTLNLKEGAPKKKLESAMEGHILDEAVLRGRYAPK